MLLLLLLVLLRDGSRGQSDGEPQRPALDGPPFGQTDAAVGHALRPQPAVADLVAGRRLRVAQRRPARARPARPGRLHRPRLPFPLPFPLGRPLCLDILSLTDLMGKKKPITSVQVDARRSYYSFDVLLRFKCRN